MSRLTTARLLAAVAAASLLVASLVHFGYFVEGYSHDGAAVPEAVIGSVMLVGLALSWAPAPWGWRGLVGALGFGLAGSLVGLYLVMIGIGPQTVADVVYHVLLVATLIAGLYVAWRVPRGSTRAIG
ncbi:MAG TPA: hypothetical protein VHL52_01100 [Acidimicrobiia bacterium]|nr:hypothetical protein [Acidimicrobiia bacterium]